MSRGKSTVKKIMKVLGGIFISVILIIAVFAAFLMMGKTKTLNLELHGLSLENVDDGTYIGSYDGFRWSNTVEISVKDHQITDIKEIKSQVFATKENVQKLKNLVISQQTTKVDAISGATADSNAFLKAVENALESE